MICSVFVGGVPFCKQSTNLLSIRTILFMWLAHCSLTSTCTSVENILQCQGPKKFIDLVPYL